MFNRKEYQKGYIKQWKKDNAEHVKEYDRRWKEDNSEYIIKYQKQRYWGNREEELERVRLWRKDNLGYQKQWQKNNPEKTEASRKKYFKNRRKTDLRFNLNHRIRTVIGKSLKGNKNGRHWENLVGYSLTNLIKYLKRTIPKDYNWRDYINGELVIDHIIPIRAFIFRRPEDNEFKQCWSLYNLRLLTKKGNSEKSDSINNPILLGLLLRMCEQ